MIELRIAKIKKKDTILCPECGTRNGFIIHGGYNYYCHNCGLDIYGDDPQWESLPWNTFEPADEII